MSRPTLDQLKLARDGHLQPTSCVGERPSPPRWASWMRWSIERDESGVPVRMYWRGRACEHRSPVGWYCGRSVNHDGQHVAGRGRWTVRWSDGAEQYEVRT